MAQKKQASSPEGNKLAVASIKMDPSPDIATYYVNHIEIGNSPQDFNLLCGRLPGKLSLDQTEELKATGSFTIDPEVQLIIPTTLVSGLIRALTTQKATYEQTYGVELKEFGDQE